MSNKRRLIKGSENYEVGKGRPPQETRWKPGQSGNPKGRRKGRKNLATLFHEEMSKKVAMLENGQRRMITKAEAALKQLINSATKGNPKAIQAIINISKEMGDLKLPGPMQVPTRRRFTLSIFEKNPLTGDHVEAEPMKSPRLIGNSSSS
jgi:hypothetical protein